MPPQLSGDFADIDGNVAPGVAGFQQMKALGFRTITLQCAYGRATGGQSPVYKDKVWPRDQAAIVAAGMNCSGYIFVCFPNKGRTTPEPEVQIDAFADVWIKQLGADMGRPPPGSRPQYGIPCIDIEEASDMLDANGYYDWTLRAAKRVREIWGVWPEIYWSDRVYTEYFKNHAPGQLALCPQFVAKPWPWAPNTRAHLDGAPSYQPALIQQFGNAWARYQYMGDAIGVPAISNTIDLGRYNMVGVGAAGQWVMWLQARAGGLKIDGQYGTLTKARIQEIQREYKLDTDGITGADTATLLGWLNPAPL